MKDIDASAFYALIPSLEPLRISDYLASEGWTLVERREGLLEYWEEPHSYSESEGEQYTYLLPLSYEIRNFERRLVEFLVELADFYDCNADGIRERLIKRDWDAVLVRVLSQEKSDSIGLFEARESSKLASSWSNSLLCTRQTQSDPSPVLRGRLLTPSCVIMSSSGIRSRVASYSPFSL